MLYSQLPLEHILSSNRNSYSIQSRIFNTSPESKFASTDYCVRGIELYLLKKSIIFWRKDIKTSYGLNEKHEIYMYGLKSLRYALIQIQLFYFHIDSIYKNMLKVQLKRSKFHSFQDKFQQIFDGNRRKNLFFEQVIISHKWS